MTDPVRRLPTDNPLAYAFEITGEVSTEAMAAMAKTMNAAFDANAQKIDMLLVFRQFDGSETGATWDSDVIASRFRSLSNVDKYVVVGAPDGAARMINVMNKIMPVDARSFDLDRIDEAWALIGARPVTDRA